MRSALKNLIITDQLIDFFSKSPDLWSVIKSIIEGTREQKISLRLLEFVVQHETPLIPSDILERIETTKMGIGKKHLDPFRRVYLPEAMKNIEQIVMPDGTVTSVPQLNFFRMLVVTGVLDFVLSHTPELRRFMKNFVARRPEQPIATTAKKRKRCNEFSLRNNHSFPVPTTTKVFFGVKKHACSVV